MRINKPCGARRQRTRLSLVALVVLGACEASSAPIASVNEPQYRLISIDSISLPTLALAVNADSTFLVTEVVTLRDDGVAAFVREYQTFAPAVPVRVGRMEFYFAYTKSGATIQMDNGVVCFAYPCPRVTLVGDITDLSLQMVASEPPRRVYRYARLVPRSAAP